MLGALLLRRQRLREARELWAAHRGPAAMRRLAQWQDPAVLVDILNSLLALNSPGVPSASRGEQAVTVTGHGVTLCEHGDTVLGLAVTGEWGEGESRTNSGGEHRTEAVTATVLSAEASPPSGGGVPQGCDANSEGEHTGTVPSAEASRPWLSLGLAGCAVLLPLLKDLLHAPYTG